MSDQNYDFPSFFEDTFSSGITFLSSAFDKLAKQAFTQAKTAELLANAFADDFYKFAEKAYEYEQRAIDNFDIHAGKKYAEIAKKLSATADERILMSAEEYVTKNFKTAAATLYEVESKAGAYFDGLQILLSALTAAETGNYDPLGKACASTL